MIQKRLGKKIISLLIFMAMGLTIFHLSAFAQEDGSAEPVIFQNEKFRLWMIQALGIDTNHDGQLSQAELDVVEALLINDETAHWAPQTDLSDFQDLADICHMHSLKTLEIDLYDPDYSEHGNRHPLEDIIFPVSLKNLTMKNIYWEKADNADISFVNINTLQLYHTDLIVRNGDGTYSDFTSDIVVTDTEGMLQSCIIEGSNVKCIKLINNSNGKGIKDQDEKQRIRFSAPQCQNLESVEFLDEGYAVEGSLDLENDSKLTHVGVPNEDKSKWTVYGEFDSTYAPINVTLNGCTQFGSDCNEIFIDYDFINGRDINVQTMGTSFSDDHKLTIVRQPRMEGDRAGNVYLSCDNDNDCWVYKTYHKNTGFVIEDRTSFPTIAVFAEGQRIRTAGEGQHSSESIYTEDTDRWVERNAWVHSIMEPSISERKWILKPGGHISSFGDLKFYTVDKSEAAAESLRKVFYKGDVYVEWEKQGTEDSIITLPTVLDEEIGGYKLTGTELKSTGIPGEVWISLYVYKTENGNKVKSYIGYQEIKVYQMPTSVELLNDGTMRGSGTKDDPFVVDKNEELKLQARFLVNGDVDRSGDYALRDVEWRIKAYNETSNDISDADGYSKYGSKLTITPEIRLVRGELADGETEEQYDKKVDNIGEDGRKAEYFNHRRLLFDTDGLKFKIVAGLKNELNIYKEVFVEYHIFSSECDSVCDGCGYERVATGSHDFSTLVIEGLEGQLVSAATCTANAVYKNVCLACHTFGSETFELEGSALGHTPIADSEVAATCFTAGKAEGSHCSVCGTTIKAQDTIPATGEHKWNAGEVIKAATCIEKGSMKYTCTTSGCTQTKMEAISATGHTEVVDGAVAATCGAAGKTEGSHCSVCNIVLKEQQDTPVTGKHTWDKGKVTKKATTTKKGAKKYTCKVCGATKTEEIGKVQSIKVDSSVSKKITLKESDVSKGKKTYSIKAKAKTSCSYKLTKGSSKYVSVSSKGKITVKKGAKKGTYVITVTAKKNKTYQEATKKITIVIKK